MDFWSKNAYLCTKYLEFLWFRESNDKTVRELVGFDWLGIAWNYLLLGNFIATVGAFNGFTAQHIPIVIDNIIKHFGHIFVVLVTNERNEYRIWLIDWPKVSANNLRISYEMPETEAILVYVWHYDPNGRLRHWNPFTLELRSASNRD